jgi:hypothetical protein
MIGTRHEKAVIVLTSYVIGFTTAFIAFGLTTMHYSDKQMSKRAPHMQSAKKVDYKEVHNNISAIGTDESGLYVTIGGYNRIISGNKNALEASVIASITGPGYAVKHHMPQVTEDGWFAFYCEQAEEGATDCAPFVYSLFDDTIHKVTLDGVHESLTIDDVNVSWAENNQLIINSFTSSDPKMPWIFNYADSTEVIDPVAIDEAVTTEEAPEETTEITPVEDPVAADTATEELPLDEAIQVQ